MVQIGFKSLKSCFSTTFGTKRTLNMYLGSNTAKLFVIQRGLKSHIEIMQQLTTVATKFFINDSLLLPMVRQFFSIGSLGTVHPSSQMKIRNELSQRMLKWMARMLFHPLYLYFSFSAKQLFSIYAYQVYR